MSLTNRSIQTIKTGQVIWDEKLSGFGARKQTSNGNTSFFVKTRLNGRQKLITIGKYGVWTIQGARKEAIRLLAVISTGENPLNDEKIDNLKFTDLANHWMENHAQKHLKETSSRRYFELMRDYILPAFGNKYVDSISPQMIVRFHDQLNNKTRTANYCISTISSIWNWSLKRDFIKYDNPTVKVKKYKEVKRKRYLSFEEAVKLGKSLDDEYANNPFAVAAIKILIMTGARLSEILTAKWEWLHGDILKLPDSKTGEKEISLPSPVLEILEKLPRSINSTYIIPGRVRGKPMVNLRKPWMRIIARAGIEHIRLHDLRHSFASFAVGQGATLALIGGQLGHNSIATTQRYAHLANDPIKQMTEKTANSISQALSNNG